MKNKHVVLDHLLRLAYRGGAARLLAEYAGDPPNAVVWMSNQLGYLHDDGCRPFPEVLDSILKRHATEAMKEFKQALTEIIEDDTK